MKGVVSSIVGICVCLALCEQLLDQNRHFRLIRLLLGLQLAGIIVRMAIDFAQRIS